MGDGIRAIVAQYAQYGWFLAIWGVPLAALMIAGGLSMRTAGARVTKPEREGSPGALSTWALIALIAFLCAYSYALVSREDLVGLDYAQLTAKRFVGMQIWPYNGRFFPLGLQEYNLLALIGKTAWLYHTFSVVELGLVIACVFRLLDEVPIWLRCVTVVSTIVIPSIQQPFFGLLFPERDLLLWLALWLVCVQSFTRTKKASAWYASLIATQFLLYYKEPAFVLVGGFAGVRVCLGAWADRDALKRGEVVPVITRHSLELAMLALCGVFLAIYAAAIRPHITASYVAEQPTGSTIWPALIGYMRSDLVLDAMVVVFALRAFAVARGKRRLDRLWDPAAAGAIAYALAFIKLGLTREYYLAPSDFVGALYLTQVGYGALRHQTRVTIVAAFLAVALLFQRNVRDDAYMVLARKQFVAANVSLAEFLKGYARDRRVQKLSLYFPQAGGFQLMELSSFLQYKGLRAASATDGSDSVGFTITSPHRYPDGLCHPSQDFRCGYEPTPGAGDLVILLPGHAVTPAQLERFRTDAREVMHFTPRRAALERTLAVLVSDDRLADLSSDAYVFAYGSPKN